MTLVAFQTSQTFRASNKSSQFLGITWYVNSVIKTRPASVKIQLCFCSQSPSLSVLVQLYVTRCYHVWKESELLPWLERNVHTVLDRVDHGDSFVTDSESKRAKRYPTLPRNIHRHIILADFKDVTFSEVSTEGFKVLHM